MSNEIEINPADIQITEYLAHPPGFGVNYNGVELKHIPTGTIVRAEGERSQHKNRYNAVEKLKAALATNPPLLNRHVGEVAPSTDGSGLMTIRWVEGLQPNRRLLYGDKLYAEPQSNDAIAALTALTTAKEYKEQYGKDGVYEAMRKAAWEQAYAALEKK